MLGVDPAAEGKGLGRVLLDAGLAHLARGGATSCILYVEGDNARVVTMYRNAGFVVANRDVLYGRDPR